MCWKCDLIAPKCRNFTFPDWMETSLEPFPPAIEPSDDFPPQPAERSAYFPAAVRATQEHKDEARRAPARRNVAAIPAHATRSAQKVSWCTLSSFVTAAAQISRQTRDNTHCIFSPIAQTVLAFTPHQRDGRSQNVVHII